MSEQTVLMAIEDGVAAVTLNRPQVKNALDLQMRFELCEMFNRIRADRDIRAVNAFRQNHIALHRGVIGTDANEVVGLPGQGISRGKPLH